ncbi:hypothetical protein DWY99_07570 [[Clostridium] leptum]|uniref:Uncharacterized protein n=1 Tax=[Clostridium] leptum TaxID=1535 RepID=A0A412AXE1_9FIRM|nr:hypothetical protein DWY99_07570 [[Clostridium] leptum]
MTDASFPQGMPDILKPLVSSSACGSFIFPPFRVLAAPDCLRQGRRRFPDRKTAALRRFAAGPLFSPGA